MRDVVKGRRAVENTSGIGRHEMNAFSIWKVY